MSHGVSIARAKRLAKHAPATCVTTTRIGGDGRLHAELMVDVDDARLRRGRGQDLLAVFYGSAMADDPQPLATPDGRHAITMPLSAHPQEGQDACCLRIDVRLTEHAGEGVDVVVARVPSKRVPIAITTALVAACLLAAWLLGAWGDPSARKGHYEGKTPEEIQEDLDADVAWHSMEISVASHVTMAEGSTACELRVENIEANHCDQKVRVWETGHEDDVLYESGAIAPGEYLQFVELAHALPVGTHTFTVQFQGYEQSPTLVSNEGEILGHDTFGASCAAEVTVGVMPASE